MYYIESVYGMESVGFVNIYYGQTVLCYSSSIMTS